ARFQSCMPVRPFVARRLTPRWSGRVEDKVPSSNVARAPLSSTVGRQRGRSGNMHVVPLDFRTRPWPGRTDSEVAGCAMDAFHVWDGSDGGRYGGMRSGRELRLESAI